MATAEKTESVANLQAQIAQLTQDKKNLQQAVANEQTKTEQANALVAKLQQAQDKFKRGVGAGTVAVKLRKPLRIHGRDELPAEFVIAEIRCHEVTPDTVASCIVNGMTRQETIEASQKDTVDAQRLLEANQKVAALAAEVAELGKINETLVAELDAARAGEPGKK